jgi:DNA-binding MarR family transcriptional regulator
MRLFKAVATSSAQSSDIGSLERAGMLFRLKSGTCRPGWLAQHGTRSPSAVTEIVEGLERDGFVRRESDPADRRAVRVALTADGRRLIQRFENAAALALADRFTALTPTQRQRLRAAFADLHELLPDDFTTSSHPDANVPSTPRAHKEAAHAR